MTSLTKLERDFQSDVIKELKELFKGAIILKNDSGYLQGIPDWVMLFKDKWALLEIKRFANSKKQPNQDFYIDLANRMSFGRFIHQENKTEVFEELKRFFGND